MRQDAEQRPGMIDDVIQRLLFLSANGGGSFWHLLMDMILRLRHYGEMKPSEKGHQRNENRKLTISTSVSGTEVEAIISDIFFLNVCFALLNHSFKKLQKKSSPGQESAYICKFFCSKCTVGPWGKTKKISAARKVMSFNCGTAENNSWK